MKGFRYDGTFGEEIRSYQQLHCVYGYLNDMVYDYDTFTYDSTQKGYIGTYNSSGTEWTLLIKCIRGQGLFMRAQDTKNSENWRTFYLYDIGTTVVEVPEVFR